MVIAKTTIQSLLFFKNLVVDPRHEQTLQPASIDLSLGDTIGKYSTLGVLDFHQDPPTVDLTKIPPQGYVIPAGSGVLASTKEHVRIPKDVCALLVARSTVSRMFLMVSTLTGFIDPGFEGTLDLQIVNVGNNPVRLYDGNRIAQLVLFQLTTTEEYRGKYQGKSSVTGMKPDEDRPII